MSPSSNTIRSLLLFPLITLNPVYAITPSTYQPDSHFSSPTFFSNFDFFTDSDPTHGFVTYINQAAARTSGLISTLETGSEYIGVDHTNTLTPSGPGRKSVRISSKKSWTHGLFLVDLAHMPGSICGTWPALWLLGPNWPDGGEIDVIEGVNSSSRNLMSGHTSPGCTIDGIGEKGTLQTVDCDAWVGGNQGCGVSAGSEGSYGDGFNEGGGGVYGVEWTGGYIRIWFFPRLSIPTDIMAGLPDPSTWGLPQANFQGSCDIDSHFNNMSIVFDTTFCGDWAANVWAYDSVCSALDAKGCVDFVAGYPSAFAQSYWAVNYVDVYTLGVTPPTPTSTSKSSSTKTSSSSSKPVTTSTKATSSSSTPYSSSASSSIKHTTSSNSVTEHAIFISSSHSSSSNIHSTSSISHSSTKPTPISTLTAPATSPPNTGKTSHNPLHPFFPLSLSQPLTSLQNENPPLLPPFTLLGCLPSTSTSTSTSPLTPFTPFKPHTTTPNMTLNLCTSLCTNNIFAGTRGGECYCWNTLGLFTDLGTCDIGCPGDGGQICGGEADGGKKGERDRNWGFSLTVYWNEEGDVGVYRKGLVDGEGGQRLGTGVGTASVTGDGQRYSGNGDGFSGETESAKTGVRPEGRVVGVGAGGMMGWNSTGTETGTGTGPLPYRTGGVKGSWNETVVSSNGLRGGMKWVLGFGIGMVVVFGVVGL